eukprot:1160688-Pelagomonas_calceolata.AAC.6
MGRPRGLLPDLIHTMPSSMAALICMGKGWILLGWGEAKRRGSSSAPIFVWTRAVVALISSKGQQIRRKKLREKSCK